MAQPLHDDDDDNSKVVSVLFQLVPVLPFPCTCTRLNGSWHLHLVHMPSKATSGTRRET